MSDLNRIRTELIMRRMIASMSQRELGRRMGKDQTTVAFLEKSLSPSARVDTLVRWASALDCELELSLVPYADAIDRAAERIRREVVGKGTAEWLDLTDDDRDFWRRVARAAQGA